jgi:hypothetical protein
MLKGGDRAPSIESPTMQNRPWGANMTTNPDGSAHIDFFAPSGVARCSLRT